jgi:hypothetical protein
VGVLILFLILVLLHACIIYLWTRFSYSSNALLPSLWPPPSISYRFDKFNEFDHFVTKLYKYLNLVADAAYLVGAHSCHSEALGQLAFDLANTGTAPGP